MFLVERCLLTWQFKQAADFLFFDALPRLFFFSFCLSPLPFSVFQPLYSRPLFSCLVNHSIVTIVCISLVVLPQTIPSLPTTPSRLVEPHILPLSCTTLCRTPMAPSDVQVTIRSQHGKEEPQSSQRSSPDPMDPEDEDTLALRCAQKELLVAYEALEQLLGVMRRADNKQIQSLFAASQKRLPQAEIMAMVKQYTKDNEESAAK